MLTAIRRSMVALVAAGAVAAFLRLRGDGGTPSNQGGWRELRSPDFD